MDLMRLYARALAMWGALLVLAIANGAVRERLLAPRFGVAALPVSGVILMLVFAAAIAAFVRITRPGVAEAVPIAVFWLVLTLAAETGLIVAAGRPAADVFATLGPAAAARGELFGPLLLVTTLTPVLFAWAWRRG